MSFWTAIVVLFAIAAVTSVIRGRQRTNAGIISDKEGNEQYADRNDPDAQRELKELRERIKVLERIATDANTTEARKVKAISDEIESLREK